MSDISIKCDGRRNVSKAGPPEDGFVSREEGPSQVGNRDQLCDAEAKNLAAGLV